MMLLLKYTLMYMMVLMLVALGGMFSERSGIINIALEGIMVIGGLVGVLMTRMLPADLPAWAMVTLSILGSAISGAIYAALLAFASVNLKADQTWRWLRQSGSTADSPAKWTLITPPSPSILAA